MLLRGVLLDLDDTLYPQADFLGQAWHRVSEVGMGFGLDPAELYTALTRETEAGSDRGGLIDRAVHRLGAPPEIVPDLVNAFMEFRPSRLSVYPGVMHRLTCLARRLPIVVITDGNPTQQRAKLTATGLAPLIAGTVCTDEFGGRKFRKPHPAGFSAGLSMLGCTADYAAMVGDRPDKDVIGAGFLGIKTVLVRQGEYWRSAVPHPPWHQVDGIREALDFLLEQPYEKASA